VYDDTDAEVRSGRVTPVVFHFVYRRRVAEVLLDLCLCAIAYYSAYRLRFEGAELAAYFPAFLQSLPLVVGVQSVALYAMGGYRGVWRYFGLMDGVAFAQGVFVGTTLSVFLIVFAFRFDNYSRGVFVIYAALMMLSLIGTRASFRLISEFAHRRRPAGSRLVIYGAGAGGAAAVRELLSPGGLVYRMLGFIDDDPGMARARMQGYPVLGDFKSLDSLIRNGAVDTVVLSTHLIDVERLDALKALCAEHQVALSRLHYKLDQLVAVS
jgi:UDP-GlcNAc:undecaprenyl-phosphate GlcNAc-1-phosphate transferase